VLAAFEFYVGKYIKRKTILSLTDYYGVIVQAMSLL